jgi:predicted CopG family antitoxin
MAVKTITIDLEAYEALARRKGPGESFSQVIKSHFGGRRTGRDLKEILRQVRLAEKTVDAVEAVVRARRRSPFRAPRL